jgi:tetratricopeptide (TPR) repeat protein
MTARGIPKFEEEIRRAEQFRRTGQTGLAAKVLRSILDHDPDHFSANYALGMLYHRAGRNDLALPLLSRAVTVYPEFFESTLNLGIIQHEAGMLTQALVNLKNAVSLRPDNSMAKLTLGSLLSEMGQLEGAAMELCGALELEPGNDEILMQLGVLEQARGSLNRAAERYREAIAVNPGNGEACYRLALLRDKSGQSGLIRQMNETWHGDKLSDADRVLLGFSLGLALDGEERYDEAIEYFHAANRLQRKSLDYSHDRQQAFFDRHRRELNQAFLDRCRGHAKDDETAIFIVGLPRSGTSLVEQILASHPRIHGAGEVEYTRLFVEETEKLTGRPFPEGIGSVDPAVFTRLGEAYISQLKAHDANAVRIIDKLPHNFLRIGLFAGVVPNARIILCERNPLDTCLSIYQHFFSPAHGYSTDLEALGRYYRLYRELIEYWQELLPGKIHRIAYEDLVSDPEYRIRQLLEYCGLPFADTCLSFHETRRAVTSPSAAQVREPLHSDSVGRWRNYENHLHPLMQALDRERS